MLNQSTDLDRMFHALSDPGRRAMLDRLVRGPASVKDLAEPLAMSLPAVLQHLQVLEVGGLLTSQKIGRVRTCSLRPDALRAAEAWLSDRRGIWESRFDRLGQFLSEQDDQSGDRS